MILLYALLGIVIFFPLILVAIAIGALGGFIHGRINRARRRRLQRLNWSYGNEAE